jgi:AraC-like DNA-binding protein
VRHLAIAMMERELLSRDLTPDRIAVTLGVSRSTLYRAFEAAGGVITSIQRRRLAHAYALLRQRQGRTPTVADIAYVCGFASESHFGRAFRDRFDISPGDLGVGREGIMPVPVGDQFRHDVCMDWLRSQ